MAEVLTTGSTISCPASGKVSLSSNNKLKVNGKPVLVISDISGKSVGGCTTVTDSNQGTKQCMTVASASGTSTKLKAGGAPVANSTFSGSTDGTSNSLSATPAQNKLKA